MTTRKPGRSAAEMGFCIVQGLDGDDGNTAVLGEALGVAPCLAAHEERDLAEFLFGVAGPADGESDSVGRSAPMQGMKERVP